jgi:hypothetical protein
MNRILSLLVCLVLGLTSFAQENIQIDEDERAILYLKGGSQIEVTVIEWDENLGIKVITLWGQEMFFPADRIHKVKSLSKKAYNSHYVFKEKGIFYAMSAGLITGNNGFRNSEKNGYTLSFSSGIRLNRLLSVGIGTSVDQYAHGFGERMHPIFIDLRSYLLPKNSTLVVNLQTGYSLAFKNENKGITDAKGGFMFYPSLGMSFGGSVTKYSIDLGYKFQQATWTYTNQWDTRNSTEFRMDYQRFVLRFGIVL